MGLIQTLPSSLWWYDDDKDGTSGYHANTDEEEMSKIFHEIARIHRVHKWGKNFLRLQLTMDKALFHFMALTTHAVHQNHSSCSSTNMQNVRS